MMLPARRRPPGRVRGGLRRAEDALLAALLLALILVGGAQIFARNIVGEGLGGADEAMRLLVLWVAMLGAVAASRDRRQLRIDLISRLLRGRPRLLAEAFADLLTAVVSGLIAWHAGAFVRESLAYGDTLVGGVPAWLVQLVLPLAFLLIAWRHLADGLLALLAAARGGDA